MVRNICFYNNVSVPQKVAFRAKNENAPISYPVETGNLNGMNAISSYNLAFINKSNDKFNIPLVKPIPMPRDIQSIDGEKIYNSKGVLECVEKDTKDKKYVYRDFGDNEIRLFVVDKKTGNTILEQGEHIGEVSHQTWVWQFDPITGKQVAHADYEDGQPKAKGVTRYKSDGSVEQTEFMFDDGTYIVSDGNSTKNYDINKKITYECIYKQLQDGYNEKEINYSSGKPVTTKNKEVHGKISNEYASYINEPNHQRAACPEFIDSIDNIEGEKTYYSNGKLESVKTPDGKLFEQSFDGKAVTLTENNKTIRFVKEPGDGKRRCYIDEDLGNATKTTCYFDVDKDLGGNLTYKQGNISQFVYFNNDGKPTSYKKRDESKEYKDSLILGIDYAPNGAVLDVYHSYDEKGLIIGK